MISKEFRRLFLNINLKKRKKINFYFNWVFMIDDSFLEIYQFPYLIFIFPLLIKKNIYDIYIKLLNIKRNHALLILLI